MFYAVPTARVIFTAKTSPHANPSSHIILTPGRPVMFRGPHFIISTMQAVPKMKRWQSQDGIKTWRSFLLYLPQSSGVTEGLFFLRCGSPSPDSLMVMWNRVFSGPAIRAGVPIETVRQTNQPTKHDGRFGPYLSHYMKLIRPHLRIAYHWYRNTLIDYYNHLKDRKENFVFKPDSNPKYREKEIQENAIHTFEKHYCTISDK